MLVFFFFVYFLYESLQFLHLTLSLPSRLLPQSSPCAFSLPLQMSSGLFLFVYISKLFYPTDPLSRHIFKPSQPLLTESKLLNHLPSFWSAHQETCSCWSLLEKFSAWFFCHCCLIILPFQLCCCCTLTKHSSPLISIHSTLPASCSPTLFVHCPFLYKVDPQSKCFLRSTQITVPNHQPVDHLSKASGSKLIPDPYHFDHILYFSCWFTP